MISDDLPTAPAKCRLWQRAAPLRVLVLLLGTAVMYLVDFVVR